MKYGVCAGPDSAAILAKAGFDYVEINTSRMLKPQDPDEAFDLELKKIRSSALPCSAGNGFLPGSLKVTGPDASLERLAAYAETAAARARKAGMETVVFGSGGARRVPDGFPRAKAEEQLQAFLRTLGPIGRKHGVVFAVEPLRQKECNILNTVTEAARLVREVNHPNIRLLVDAYHWAAEKESAEAIVSNGDLLRHAHIATTKSRLAPGAEECDFSEFFRALKAANYAGRLSIEGKWDNMATQAARAREELRRYQ